MFASASFISVSSFVIVCLVLATRNWVSSKINYSEGNSTVAVSITYGLFQGVCFKTAQAGLGKEETPFQGNYCSYFCECPFLLVGVVWLCDT